MFCLRTTKSKDKDAGITSTSPPATDAPITTDVASVAGITSVTAPNDDTGTPVGITSAGRPNDDTGTPTGITSAGRPNDNAGTPVGITAAGMDDLMVEHIGNPGNTTPNIPQGALDTSDKDYLCTYN